MNNDKRWRNRARAVGNGLSDRGQAGLVAATVGDSAGVSQTDAGRPWAAAAAALLVIHGVAAGMGRESQLRLWYTGGGRLERRVERWAAQWRNVSPDWLITYPMQCKQSTPFIAYLYCNGIFC